MAKVSSTADLLPIGQDLLAWEGIKVFLYSYQLRKNIFGLKMWLKLVGGFTTDSAEYTGMGS